MQKIGILGSIIIISVFAHGSAIASKGSTMSSVVPPVGSTCESDKSGTEQHCTFPDGSKWICNKDLTKCHRKQKGTPSTIVPGVKPTDAVTEKSGATQTTPQKTVPTSSVKTRDPGTEGVVVQGNHVTLQPGFTLKRVSSNEVVVVKDARATSAAGIRISCSCGRGSGTCVIRKNSPTGGLFCENGTCNTCGWSEIEGIKPHLTPR